MATSIQVAGSKVVFFNDLSLLVIMKMMTEEIAAGCASLRELADVWSESIETFGPGTIDLELNMIKEDTAKKLAFMDLTSRIEEKVRSFGKTIPGDTITRRWSVKGVEFYDYPVDLLLAALDGLRELLDIDA